MGMPRGLAKATNYYNRLEAWRDFRLIYANAVAIGLGDQAIEFYPPDDAGWRTIDKSIAKIRELIKCRMDGIIDLPRPD